MMRPIHNVVSGVQGLLWTPKKGGRLPLFGGTVRAGFALSRFASQPKALLTIAARHHKLIAALAMVAIWAGTFHAIGRL